MVSLADIHIGRNGDDDGSYPSMESVFAAQAEPLDERRLQVRAYHHWLAQVEGSELPAIEELQPESLVEFGPNGVLVDFTLGIDRPAIIHLGANLAVECDDDREVYALGDVPERSLLSRLTEHCLEVIANRAPVGYDAEFEDRAGQTVFYRSILLPYSSDGRVIDFVFGVISWKREAARVEVAVTPPAPRLANLLAAARELATEARTGEQRTRRAWYAAISRTHDLALAADRDPRGLAALLRDNGIACQDRAPLVALAKLVFGTGHAKSRLTEIALVLGHARRSGVTAGQLAALLETTPGGIKGLIVAERALRNGQSKRKVGNRLALSLRDLPALTAAEICAPESEFVLLVARREPGGALSVIGNPGDVRLFETAAKRLLAA
jgi:hypothetical protein